MYKKIVLAAFLLFSVAQMVIAQNVPLRVNGQYYAETDNLTGVDQVIVFKSIDATSSVTYTGGKTPVIWTAFDGTLLLNGSEEFSNLEDNMGYIVTAGTGSTKDSITFYVIDYEANLPTLNSLIVDESFESSCEETCLLLDAVIPPLSYQDPSGATHSLEQTFRVSYTTLQWSDNAWQEIAKDTTVNAATTLFVTAPLTNTTFKVTYTTYTDELNITDTISVESDIYQAVAIDMHPTSITEVRNATNEIDRPSETTTIKGSAPLVIQFLANANEPVAQYYNWQIKRGTELLAQRTDKEHRYSFEDAGIYDVTLRVSNAAGCMDTTSFRIETSVSSLMVPNVFTPNGDGKNDEFRVAYKSIITFEGFVYNRWGRRVFTWTDPGKGWDGNINGQPASPGVYFYVIQAEGSDGVKYRLKGDVTLIGR